MDKRTATYKQLRKKYLDDPEALRQHVKEVYREYIEEMGVVFIDEETMRVYAKKRISDTDKGPGSS